MRIFRFSTSNYLNFHATKKEGEKIIKELKRRKLIPEEDVTTVYEVRVTTFEKFFEE